MINMILATVFFALTAMGAAGFEDAGIVNDETGERLVERVFDTRLEMAEMPAVSAGYSYSGLSCPNLFEQAEILWSAEDWLTTHGAMCEDIDVSGNGAYIFNSWSLNYEKWELYESAGSGTPVWTYDLCAGDKSVKDDISGDISSDGSVITGCVPGWRDDSGNYKGTLFKFSVSSSTPDWTYDFPYISTSLGQSSRPRDVRVTPDGSTIVCLVANITDDPEKPHQLYVFDSSSSTPTLIVDLPNTDETPVGLDITDDASLMVYSTYKNVYVYDSSGNQINSFSIDHGWQYAPAISQDGQWMVYGNYRGHVRLNEWNGSEFSQSWQYIIPPDYYYPWVCSVDIAANTLMVSSYQANASGNRGYAYIFNTSSPSPTWKSEDFGDLTGCVALNSNDATAGIAASWGSLSGSGMRSALFMTDSSIPYFTLDQSYPGSNFACEISEDGAIAATGGKRVHARQMGSGGWIYCIESTETGIEATASSSIQSFGLTGICPNPVCGITTICFSLPGGCMGNARLDLFDMKGRKVDTLLYTELLPGENEIILDTANLFAGVYTCCLSAGDHLSTGRMVVID
ncbi:MAG: hypothetical protein K8S62_08055 [Candidatus Sabulitectum sp.]|nr:hypothetical protein [Candidatus Sabulitectum sp.]